jgi:hypothetical protein
MRPAVPSKLPNPTPALTPASKPKDRDCCGAMSVRRLQTMDALAVLSSELACADENVDIDFGAVGLYLVGFQVAFCVLACASVSVLACWLLPPPAVSAVRTLALMALVGTLLVMKPLRVGRPRGVASVFNVLRPSVAVYISALVLEQLVHTCVLPEDALEGGTLRRSIFHGATLLLVLAGVVRARSPRAESDLTFLLATFALLVLAVAPPPAVSHTGPLCQPATLLGAGERLLRAALFAAVYAVLAYAATPRRCVSNDVFVCSARAAAGSVWVLAVHAWLLLMAPVQVIVALFARLAEEDDGLMPSGSKAEWAPLNGTGSITPDRPGCGAGLDLEGAGVGGALALAPADGEALVPVTLKSGLRFELSAHSHSNASAGLARVGGGAAVAATGACGGVSSQALAEVVARESMAMNP